MAQSITLDATANGANYEWDNGSTNATRTVSQPGTYWVLITKDDCELRDTVIVSAVQAMRFIDETLCPEESIVVDGVIFDQSNPSGTVTIPQAHPSGCDSIITVALDFYDVETTTFSRTICEGDSTKFNGHMNGRVAKIHRRWWRM